MANTKKPFCLDCGVKKTDENCGYWYKEDGSVGGFMSRCSECDTARSREYQWSRLPDDVLLKRLEKYKKYAADLEEYIKRGP